MKKDKQKDMISTFLGPEVSVEGNIDFGGTIRVDGKVKGTIHSDGGTLIVGEHALIDADIIVDAAIITGAVNGNIEVREKLEIFPPACVTGSIKAPTISIESGAVFNGNCEMKRPAIPLAVKKDSTAKTAA
ncbi:MAG: polymer-forming cytoskeletal protein [Thermodesulfobacteriota bacterium]